MFATKAAYHNTFFVVHIIELHAEKKYSCMFAGEKQRAALAPESFLF